MCSRHFPRPLLFRIIFFRERDGYKFEDAVTVTGLEHVPEAQSVCGGLTTNNVRNKVADYFVTDVGAFPWQMYKIRTVQYVK